VIALLRFTPGLGSIFESASLQTGIIEQFNVLGGKWVYGFAGILAAHENSSLGLFVQHCGYAGAGYFDWFSGLLRSEGQGRAEIFVVRRDSLDGFRLPSSFSGEFSQIAKQLGPTVVNINTESTIKNPHRRRGVPGQAPDDDENGGGQGGMDDFFNRFFGGQGGPNGDAAIRERSLGSGVIVDSKGYIVTNRHVVEKADRIRVRFAGRSAGRAARCQSDREDQETDLAVIKIEMSRPVPVAKMGNSTAWKWAIGCWPLAARSARWAR